MPEYTSNMSAADRDEHKYQLEQLAAVIPSSELINGRTTLTKEFPKYFGKNAKIIDNCP